MRILVSSTSTFGDVQPCVALTLGLAQAGHDVQFASHPTFEPLITGAGLEFASLWEPDPRRIMQDVQQGTVGRRATTRMFKHLFQRSPPPREALDRQLDLCRGRDFVLSSVGNYHHATEALGVPFGYLALYPTIPTGGFPHHLSRLRISLGSPLNRLSHVAFQQLFWWPDRTWINQWRRDLGLAPLDWRGPLGNARARRIPYFYGYSPTVIPRPPDWPEWVHVTGSWFLDTTISFQPSVELERFLAAGPPPVVVAFGSLADANSAELQRILFEALERAGERAIWLSGWTPAAATEVPATVFHANWVPLRWLLPRVRAVVHHGGNGTTAEVLRAGIPSVAIPTSGEQKFWASRLYALGAAPRPIPRLQLDAASLAAAIRSAVGDPARRERVRQLAQIISAEQGVARAVQAFAQEAERLRRR